MKFCWTTIYVKNMEESLQFYQEVIGLPLIRKAKVSSEMELAFLGSGETQIELVWDGKQTNIKHSDSISLGYQCESLEAQIEILKIKKIDTVTGIIQPNPTIRFFYVFDPNGVKIQFIEFVK